MLTKVYSVGCNRLHPVAPSNQWQKTVIFFLWCYFHIVNRIWQSQSQLMPVSVCILCEWSGWLLSLENLLTLVNDALCLNRKNIKSTSAETVNNQWIKNGQQQQREAWKLGDANKKKKEQCIWKEILKSPFLTTFYRYPAQSVTTVMVTCVYTCGVEDKSIFQLASAAGFLRLTNEEFWLASHPDNGAEPVHTVGGDIGVVHTADSSSSTGLSGGLAHTQL